MIKNTPPMSKLTKVYLCKYFEKNTPPYAEWEVTVDGVTHIINNRSVINSIIQAHPQEQKIFADAIHKLESSNMEINIFLKHLAFEGNILSPNTKH